MNTKSTPTETYIFKTNINCDDCVAIVTPILNATAGIAAWNVNTVNRDTFLSVISDGITKNEIMDTVHKAGFKIEALD